jgi:hypothetical protein
MPWYQVQDLMITVAVSLAVLIPVTGLTPRFGVKPFLREIADIRAARRGQLMEDVSGERLARIERQLEDLETSMRRLVRAAEFDRKLKSRRPDWWTYSQLAMARIRCFGFVYAQNMRVVHNPRVEPLSTASGLAGATWELLH